MLFNQPTLCHSLTILRLPDTFLQKVSPYPTYTLLALQAFSLFNIAMATTPLFRKQDPCDDIPLTPAQRQLLGLPPSSRPATPQEKEQWITPPRYSRSASATPRSSSSSLRAEVSGSPIPPPSAAGAVTFGSGGRRQSGSPLTPSGVEERRRLSQNRNSPLSISEFDAAGSVSTPTKVNQRASVGLNSKWLYEKGRASPTGSRLSGSGWGTGSVFS
jgi:nucleoporin POM34